MKQQKKFNSEQQQEHVSEQQLTHNTARDFASVEELLRYDASQTQTPAAIAQRLQKSSADLPRPARSWWQRLFQR
ncbi:MAG TPA: hypothetical protein VGI88_04685 [Verrucomicrobiae bacterium]|jgi:hypothetical protein